MIDPELLKQIRRIQIFTNRAVNEMFAGQYESTFKGRGMQFDEVREYMPGDDVRTIDWNVTARTGHPHIKRFVEEREQTVMLLVDLSASGSFGSKQSFKNELAARLCAVLAFSAIKNNDKVGLLTFTDQVEHFIPPKKGAQHVLRVIRELLSAQPIHTGTDIAHALDFLGKLLHKRATVFLVSDFFTPDIRRQLGLINRRHDLIAVKVSDPREHELPDIGLVRLYDAESRDTVIIDTSSSKARAAYRQRRQQHDQHLTDMFRAARVDLIDVSTDKPFVPELIRFFRMREKRR